MKGDNPIRTPVVDDGAVLGIKSIFATLQGEGPYAGWPAVFVRLGGCNLACDFCDTDFEDFTQMSVEEIVEQVLGFRFQLVVVSGGEPLRQNIAPLCEALLARGCKIQIETNGTLYRELPAGVDIICSPKNTNGSYAPIRADLAPRITAFKFLISASDMRYHVVPYIATTAPIYVQPMDEYDAEKNAANLKRATELALAKGYRLSLQLHKIVGIP